MMSPRPPPQPPPPPLTHLRQLLTPDRVEAASSPSHRPVPPLLPPPPLPRASPNVPLVKTSEGYSYPSSSSYRPFPHPPPPPPPHSRPLPPHAGSPPRVRSNVATAPLSIIRRPLGPPLPDAAYSFGPDVGRIAHPEPYVELEQGRRRAIPPPPLYTTRADVPLTSPDPDFAAPRYVQPIGQLTGPVRSPRDRRLSNTPFLQSPNSSYTTGKKRTFDETFVEEPKPGNQQHNRASSFSSELEMLRSILPPRPTSDKFRLVVRQQPVAARACGFGERDRRVIDPPPIVQLVAADPADPANEGGIKYPWNVVHCTLYNVAGTADETALEQQDKRLTRRLMGTLVSSPFVGQDENGKEGCFFCFPDLSCRTHGKFRLKFALMCLDPNAEPSTFTRVTTEVMSDVFTVYTAKEFPGMRPSTGLTKALKRQGCAISVKKGNEKATTQQASPQEQAAGEDENNGGEEEESEPEQETTGRGKRRRKT